MMRCGAIVRQRHQHYPGVDALEGANECRDREGDDHEAGGNPDALPAYPFLESHAAAWLTAERIHPPGRAATALPTSRSDHGIWPRSPWKRNP